MTQPISLRTQVAANEVDPALAKDIQAVFTRRACIPSILCAAAHFCCTVSLDLQALLNSKTCKHECQ